MQRGHSLWLLRISKWPFSIDGETAFLLVYDANFLRRHDDEFSDRSRPSGLSLWRHYQ